MRKGITKRLVLGFLLLWKTPRQCNFYKGKHLINVDAYHFRGLIYYHHGSEHRGWEYGGARADMVLCCGIILLYTVNMYYSHWLVKSWQAGSQVGSYMGKPNWEWWEGGGRSQERHQSAAEHAEYRENEVTSHEPCGKGMDKKYGLI